MQPKKNMNSASGRAPRFLLLMRDDLRHAIEKEAIANGRTLTAEINIRLRESLKTTPAPGLAPTPPLNVQEPAPPLYLKGQGQRLPLPSTEAAMLAIFRSMPPEKQLALLSLFK